MRVRAGLLDAIGQLSGDIASTKRAVIISDTTVAPLYASRAIDSLARANIHAVLLTFPAGESNKTLATASTLLDGLFAVTPPIDRDCLIVAIGGGVVGDMAGFVAATALRGLRWVQSPTTLLADVDASVGGKTGVNHTTGKNLIGAFHHPQGVFVDVATLKTLGDPGLRDGLAECIKHAVIRDGALLEFIEDNQAAIFSGDEDLMTELIGRNVAIKAAVVAADEKEAGERAHLNMGHTIGHAIETIVGYGEISHGQAVSLGMAAACQMAVSRGLIRADLARRIEKTLERVGLPIRRGGLDAGEIWRIMQHDKKARGGHVRMILPIGLGMASVFDDVTPDAVAQAVEHLQD